MIEQLLSFPFDVISFKHLFFDFVHELLPLILLNFHDPLDVLFLVCPLDDLFVMLFQHFVFSLLLHSKKVFLFRLQFFQQRVLILLHLALVILSNLLSFFLFLIFCLLLFYGLQSLLLLNLSLALLCLLLSFIVFLFPSLFL